MTAKKTTQRNTKRKDFLNLGYIPPQARELEDAILGAMMLENRCIDTVIELLPPDAFYVEANKRIFNAIVSLTHNGQPVDILTVSEQLKKTGDIDIVGGSYYVTKLTNAVVSSANIEAHCKIVLQKYVQRCLIQLGGELVAEGYEDLTDAFDMIDSCENKMFQITKNLHRTNYHTTDKLVVEAYKEIHAAADQEEKLSGVTSGFRDVDKLTHGWQKTDLIILAARPSVGKTAFALNLARNAAASGKPTALFSLEMSSGQLIRRLMSAESEIPLDKIQRARLDKEGLKALFENGVKKLAGSSIFIDDTPAINIFELRAKVRRLKTKEKIELVVIDYLQLMSGAGKANQNREQEISDISRGLKRLAKELNIPIIALSQLSRQPENRANKEPQLSDLRESGAIEQDADVVVFMYRPEYYGIHHDSTGEISVGETTLKFAKHRNGATGSIKVRAKLWIQKFVDMEEKLPIEKSKDKAKKEGVTQTWTPFKEQVDKEDTTFK